MEAWYVCVLLGVACGVFSAMFGVGAGIIMIPALAMVLGYSQKSAQGMSLAVMAPMALVGAIRYRMNPEIEMDMARVALLATGAVAGALAGAHWVGQISGLTLRRAFAVILLAAAVRMFAAPGKERAGAGAGGPAATAGAASNPADEHADQGQ